MLLTVDRDARERQAQCRATLETAGSLRIIHDSLCAHTLRNSDLSVDFNG